MADVEVMELEVDVDPWMVGRTLRSEPHPPPPENGQKPWFVAEHEAGTEAWPGYFEDLLQPCYLKRSIGVGQVHDDLDTIREPGADVARLETLGPVTPQPGRRLPAPAS